LLLQAARIFTPLRKSLEEAAPSTLRLDAHDAWGFPSPTPRRGPAQLTASGQRRLRLRMRVGDDEDVELAPARKGTQVAGKASNGGAARSRRRQGEAEARCG
jgi:hypothetical protein